ncbi:hypothetical protein [Ochrobactrum sp. Marseille-Q0166]|uniref:hypothetical protein n=1 Tax=Ochrobactrum sp. Marseille-Q0166 TaxID=2761105 RepID=UPI001654C43B|nr:hypothetical protein [Ochrobactrum sp. Marseille-Q0166]MBC8718803.1 hypothetical protein [Ochrobactrum sp. Marseille-Q0166]
MAAKTKTERRKLRLLEQAQARANQWKPKEDIVFMDVDNPFYSRAHNASSTNPPKIRAALNAKESAISSMAARGHLSVAQIRAAKTFCSLWEAIGGAGAKAIDYSRAKVDGGKNAQDISDRQLQAGVELKKCSDLLGILGYELVVRTAGMGMTIEDIAGKERRRRDHATDSLRGCLDVLAVRWGYSNAKIRGWAA